MSENYTIRGKNLVLTSREGNYVPEITAFGHLWQCPESFVPAVVTREGEIPFAEASEITTRPLKTGIGEGWITSFSGFEGTDLAFDTIVWLEYATDEVHMELAPIREAAPGFVKEIRWPSGMKLTGGGMDAYSLLPIRQGILLPNDEPVAMGKLYFDGMFCTVSAYMPWLGQVENGFGWIGIVETPWDAAYSVEHSEGGPTAIAFRHLASLGQLAYRRTLRMTFRENYDYNDLALVYRNYALETGLLTTLAQKAARNPGVNKLIGSIFVHTGIKNNIEPTTRWYDHEHPEFNTRVVPFAVREAEMRRLKEKGLDKVYLHLDGWGQPGYDNQHPDYPPACAEAGGWEGMRSLADTMKELGYMFGVHDQYRDYYFTARTFDPENALHDIDGNIPDFNYWAGGRQSYLCATQAPMYLKRNFMQLFEHGIHLEATYLDVFNCNEGDECAHPLHKMTRRESFEWRKRCFDMLCAWDILPSSEEVGDWAMQTQVFAHYGPTEGLTRSPEKGLCGMDVPLYSLVYHDCMIVPWFINQKDVHGTDAMLLAILYGGAPYIDQTLTGKAFDEAAERAKTVAALHEKLARLAMVRHSFPDGDRNRQQAVYSDGTVVTIDPAKGTWSVEEAK